MWLQLSLAGRSDEPHLRPTLDVARRPVPYRGKTVMRLMTQRKAKSKHAAIVLRAVHGTTFVGRRPLAQMGRGRISESPVASSSG